MSSYRSWDDWVGVNRRRQTSAGWCVTLLWFGLCGYGCHKVDGASPDPIALLRGVEAARESVRSGRLEMTVVQSYPQLPRRGLSTIHLRASFDGASRRYDQRNRNLIIHASGKNDGDESFRRLRAMGEDGEEFVRLGLGSWRDTHVRSAFDGVQYMQFAEDLGAHIKDPSKGAVEFVFDPRTLGINVYSRLDETLASCLGYRDAKSVSLVGEERIAGHQTWRIRVLDKYDQINTFWIESSTGFHVRRTEFELGGVRVIQSSEYADPPTESPLPVKVLNEQFDQNKKLWQVTTFSVDKSEYGVPIDPKVWTLAGLGLPLGEMVLDDRIMRVVGHFDGQGVSANLPEALRKGREAERKPLHWALAVTGLVVLAVGAAVLVRRRNWLREGVA